MIYGLQYDEKYRDSDSNHSEDSNSENNWRNDYPDESEEESCKSQDAHSIADEDMMCAVNKLTLYGESDLSSDNYEDQEYDVEEATYGRAFARFKAKAEGGHDSSGHIHSDEYDGSCTP